MYMARASESIPMVSRVIDGGAVVGLMFRMRESTATSMLSLTIRRGVVLELDTSRLATANITAESRKNMIVLFLIWFEELQK